MALADTEDNEFCVIDDTRLRQTSRPHRPMVERSIAWLESAARLVASGAQNRAAKSGRSHRGPAGPASASTGRAATTTNVRTVASRQGRAARPFPICGRALSLGRYQGNR